MIEAFFKFSVAIVTCCISWMSSAKIWSEFPLPFGWMEACLKFFGCSSWCLIVLMLELVSVVFLAWWLRLFKISSCCWVFALSGFVVQSGFVVLLFLKLQRMFFWYCTGVAVTFFFLVQLIKLCWRVSGLLFWYLFTILELAIFACFFLLSCWIVNSWFLLMCSLI